MIKRIILSSLISLIFLNCNEVKKNHSASEKKEIKINNKKAKDCLTDFNQFFKKFSKDSIYQKEHVQYPLEYLFYNTSDYDVLTTEHIAKYKFIDFSEDNIAMQFETEKYTIEKEKTKEGMIYKRVGFDNGLYMIYEFKVINQCWYLVKITDEST